MAAKAIKGRQVFMGEDDRRSRGHETGREQVLFPPFISSAAVLGRDRSRDHRSEDLPTRSI